jgi:hypothetical protein
MPRPPKYRRAAAARATAERTLWEWVKRNCAVMGKHLTSAGRKRPKIHSGNTRESDYWVITGEFSSQENACGVFPIMSCIY